MGLLMPGAPAGGVDDTVGAGQNVSGAPSVCPAGHSRLIPCSRAQRQ